MLYSRTNFNGLKEISYYKSWKDSRIFQICQEFKVLLMLFQSISRSQKFKLYCKLLLPQIEGIQHAIIGHYWSQKKFWMFLWVCQVQWIMHKSCNHLQSIEKQHGGIFSMSLIYMKASSFISLETRTVVATMDDGAT
jgi:hypothetical protein